jgi:trk system potassium uptake protein
MRVVFNGLSDLTAKTAELLIADDHEVVIIEEDGKKIEEYSEKLDCSFLLGDGSHPEVLKEVNPEDTDILYCLSGDDQNNIIAGLIGRSLGVDRIVIRIEDPQLEEICLELGLDDVIIPSSTVGRSLKDMIDGAGSTEVSTAIKDDARLFTFIAGEKDAVAVEELELPKKSRAICYYRDEKFHLVVEGTKFKEKDEIIILTHSENLPKLEERRHG